MGWVRNPSDIWQSSRLGNSIAEAPAKFQSNMVISMHNLAGSRLCEILGKVVLSNS